MPWLLVLLCVFTLSAQPRPLEPRKTEDYAASARLEGFTLAADYLVRSIGGDNNMYLTRDHLVVEAAILPEPGEAPEISATHFLLRINGKKPELTAQSPGFVAAALKYPDWERRPELAAQGSINDRGVIIGRESPVERFPGDQRRTQQRLPRTPRAPDNTDRSGLEAQPGTPPDQFAVERALPSTAVKGPVAGYIYFYWRGNTKKIRKVELLYNGVGGNATLTLLDRR